MLTIFLRAFTLYFIMLLTLRGMGKHQLGQYQPYEFAMAMLIADLVSAPMSTVSTPLLHGILPIAALFVSHGVLTLLCMRSDRIRAFISGKPAVVISDGVIDRKELTRLCLSLSDLMEGLRISGILDPQNLGTAIIEANGTVSAFPASGARPPTADELNIKVKREGLPLMLILDGRLQVHNLATSGKDERWLFALLAHYNLTAEKVLLASLDTTGQLRVQTMDEVILSMKALSESEVCWSCGSS
ncbi:MAG: DUF421 domain-containing protein [Clostridia bacterium]